MFKISIMVDESKFNFGFLKALSCLCESINKGQKLRLIIIWISFDFCENWQYFPLWQKYQN